MAGELYDIDGSDRDADESRWDTECGVHHGWLFLSGFLLGIGAAVSTAILVMPYV